MFIRRAALLAAAMVAAASGAASAEADDPIALFTKGQYSEALRAGKQAVEKEPASGDAHYAYGVVLRNVYRRAEALRELERAHQISPKNADIAIELGWVLAETGQMERARAIAGEVAKRDGAEAASELQTWLDREKAFRSGARAALPAGGAPAFVAQVMDKLTRRQIKDVLKNDVERSVLDRWAADSGDPSATATDEFIGGIASGIERAIEARAAGLSLVGYEVRAEAPVRAGRTVVTVDLMVASSTTPQQIAMFEKAIEDPSLPVPMDPTMAAVLRGLEPADRKLSLAGLAAGSTTADFSLEFELGGGGAGGWKITEVSEPDSGLRMSRLVEMTRTLTRRGVVQMPEPRRSSRNRPYDLGYALGRVLGPVAVIAIIIAVVRRRRRRDG